MTSIMKTGPDSSYQLENPRPGLNSSRLDTKPDTNRTALDLTQCARVTRTNSSSQTRSPVVDSDLDKTVSAEINASEDRSAL
ncbi:hypothetical protein PoB_005601500 [Plakobranchus ocellatus]|uniref:Uncharacterized protein n=1 Tax=Plakobranchus ocellatus TaxID=259542 RepID=A0AAV4CCY5_9GAST|nr:hypothetical protein PoB_005601500 [Plakobranchus ocellatus]